VPEGVAVGSQVTRLLAVDADSGSFGQVTYSILSGNEVTIRPTVCVCVCVVCVCVCVRVCVCVCVCVKKTAPV